MFSPSVRSGAGKWLNTAIDEMAALRERDQKVALTVNGKEGSSIMTIGLAHLQSITHLLEEKCQLDKK